MRNAMKGRVIERGPTAVVFELTHAPKLLERYVYGCHYRTGKSYKLPHQNGGDTFHPRHFVLNGDLLAYTVLDSEPAGASAYQEVLLVDLLKRKRLVKESVFAPTAVDPDFAIGASSAKSMLVDSRGFVAWLGQYRRRSTSSYRVQVAGAGISAQVLDSGDGIRGTSLGLSEDRSTLFWTKDGAPRSAPFPLATDTSARSGGA